MAKLDETRRQVQALASEILSTSKRAIFAIHRGDIKKAASDLQNAEGKMDKADGLVKKEPRLASEGMWRAAQEEFAETDLLLQYITHDKITGTFTDPEIYLGALSDLAGEIVRLSTRAASEGKTAFVKKAHQDVMDIVELLLSMDLTGTLRTKTDQAKSHLRKIEEIEYDLSIRGR